MYRNMQTHGYVKSETDKLISLLVSSDPQVSRVFYLGITEHSNLGDMAQHYCIKNWIEENYQKCAKSFRTISFSYIVSARTNDVFFVNK